MSWDLVPIEPDSRRSLIAGFLSARCSGPRLSSCDSAMTGNLQLFASSLSARENSETSSDRRRGRTRRHQLQVPITTI